ncbi:lysylphosphatidylglycerol synthase transmembrane domain-containing protein [Conexibacter sp. SYSU D00693]|uniref:lysylphosphatidylglycerol synthase transmembrane domain-containing protein n=1 Tax=Conexibacter sp. SYSU D00693 TaxID=2812560 RepID=UPI00196A2CCF|nr:lysylphosphatidylglycerol synthase transmembrane domain-containing protein [Conexibacter sp. SYSU D00693]
MAASGPGTSSGAEGGGGVAGRRGLLLGLAVSVVAVGAVVWWASRQPAPRFPTSFEDIAPAVLALALYAVATCLRAERWGVLVRDQGGDPERADLYALTAVGFAGNTVLPARGGDAFRVVLGAPRMRIAHRPLIGTLLAERLLDVAVLATLFVVLGATIAGGRGMPKGSSLLVIAGVVLVLLVLAAVALQVLVRRGLWDKVKAFVGPMLGATTNLRGRHGAMMLGLSALIWGLEGVIWTIVGAAVDLGFGPLDGFYVLALGSMFALIPSGPGYAGTVDAATIIGVKAVGGASSAAVSYLILVRFIVFVPITVVGLAVGALRYGGLRRLRTAAA